jgi:choline dehydrogenase-like flavoprotein
MLDPLALPLTAVHPMSAMRAGRDPAHSVCDPRGQHHQVRGLYVADGGLFPTSLGGPPQISIYTAGLKVGRHVAEDLRRS